MSIKIDLRLVDIINTADVLFYPQTPSFTINTSFAPWFVSFQAAIHVDILIVFQVKVGINGYVLFTSSVHPDPSFSPLIVQFR